jgi:type IV secretion system protein VirB9
MTRDYDMTLNDARTATFAGPTRCPALPASLCARLLLFAALVASAVASATRTAQAETVPAKGLIDARVRTTAFRSDEVYRLHGYVGYQIDLEFQEGERFVGLGAGDIEALSFVGEGNHLFLKPRAARVATNLTVLTNRREYRFDYTSLPTRPAGDDPDVVYALRFTYPPDRHQEASAAEAAQLEAALRDAALARPNNVDYWYCGSPSLKPVEASDDGVHTRLRFAAQAELPAIFVRNDDGSESLLNFSMDGGDVVIHRVARRFILRRGRLAACVVNQGFVGGGLRLDSGTIAPRIERTTRGGGPK